LVVVIFIIQSMFSWPLRHPALMLYFVVVIACLASNLETFSLKTGLIKKISYFFLSLFLIIYITFFISFGKAIALELYYIPKAKNSSNFFHSLTYVDKLSKNSFLIYGANHLFVQKAFNYLWQDIFNSPFVPVTKELYKKVNREKLFHYDKRALLEATCKKAKLLYNLRPFWFYPFVISFTELVRGNYDNSYKYAKEAEHLKPNDERVFALMHFANVLKASKITGKPVSEILPSKEDIKALQEGFRKSLEKNEKK
ncbi:MAG: hypothetical protein SVN78_10800, partial [Deferribacterota bacterium]|nr:hypothetical protein [Deferribacterota bacterium]